MLEQDAQVVVSVWVSYTKFALQHYKNRNHTAHTVHRGLMVTSTMFALGAFLSIAMSWGSTVYWYHLLLALLAFFTLAAAVLNDTVYMSKGGRPLDATLSTEQYVLDDLQQLQDTTESEQEQQDQQDQQALSSKALVQRARRILKRSVLSTDNLRSDFVACAPTKHRAQVARILQVEVAQVAEAQRVEKPKPTTVPKHKKARTHKTRAPVHDSSEHDIESVKSSDSVSDSVSDSGPDSGPDVADSSDSDPDTKSGQVAGAPKSRASKKDRKSMEIL